MEGEDPTFQEVYDLGNVIGSGTFCEVRQCVHIDSGQLFSVKIVDYEKLSAVSSFSYEELRRISSLSHMLKHPHIVELLETYSSGGIFYMVYEHMGGSDLCQEIVIRADAGFVYSETVISHYMKQILEAIQYCHDSNIIHRDLKPQCILLASKENSAPVKICGFHVATMLPDASLIKTEQVGTPSCMSPEVTNGDLYGKPCDLWGCGIILFTLIAGSLPFNGPKHRVTESVLSGRYNMRTPSWEGVSSEAVDLCTKLLNVEQSVRVTVEEALQHPWIKERDKCASKSHLSNSVEELRKFNSRCKLKTKKSTSQGAILAEMHIVTPEGQPMHVPNGGSIAVPNGPHPNSAMSATGGAGTLIPNGAPHLDGYPHNDTEPLGISTLNFSTSGALSCIVDALDTPGYYEVLGSEKKTKLLSDICTDFSLHSLLDLYDSVCNKKPILSSVKSDAADCLTAAAASGDYNSPTGTGPGADGNMVEPVLLVSLCEDVFQELAMSGQTGPESDGSNAMSASQLSASLHELLSAPYLSSMLKTYDVVISELNRPRGDTTDGGGAAASGVAAAADGSDTSLSNGPQPAGVNSSGQGVMPGVGQQALQHQQSHQSMSSASSAVIMDQTQTPPVLDQNGAPLGNAVIPYPGVPIGAAPNQAGPHTVRLVQFHRGSDEPMGITLKMTDAGECLVARIMHGGMVHRQAALQVGDQIKEINGTSVANHSVDTLQEMLNHLRGRITFKIVPSQLSVPPPCELFVRALFDYDPAKDDSIPCPEAGVQFFCGEILQIISKDDQAWWQARKYTDPVHVPAGLIPSSELQEWRATLTEKERYRKENNPACGWFGKKKTKVKHSNSTRGSNALPRLPGAIEIVTYEEVVKLPAFMRKTLVLLGAHGVGRRHIKNSLIAAHPDRFAYPIPHTSRKPMMDEVDGKNYYFVTHDEMMADIAANQYLEYGTHEDAMYGTKLETIRRIHARGLIAILDVEPQALKILRCAEFAPFVVFIAAPQITTENAFSNQGSLERLMKESDVLYRSYRHLFDLIKVNDDIDDTIRTLEKAIDDVCTSPQWVPANWVY